MNSQPLVSVIVPCYNHEAFVEECIQSVLNQSYSNIELIVIDDGSKDTSVALIRNLQKTNSFVFEQQQNRGLSVTLNKAISHYATGKYIAIIASDDVWHIDKIKLQVAFMEQHPHFGMCCSKALFIDEHSAITGELNPKLFTRKYEFKEIALGKSFVPALTAMVKREVYDTVGLFDTTLLIEDLDMWLRIADKYPIGFINQVTAYYRQHGANTSSRLVAMAEARFQILDKWKHKGAIYRKMKRNFELQALSDLGKDYPEQAKKYLRYTLSNFLYPRYRKFILKYIFTGHF
jgi:glycosyltransferase involved in cell wall biosynthesis